MDRLVWDKLLCTRRQRPSLAEKKDSKPNTVIARNEFEADYDRIVGSSSVRRLQDKAQVFPLQENDFTRTRLTHSMEVSALARSLGKAVGRQLEQTGEFNYNRTDELAALLQTAGLIHDLGNPPFGHYGETVIRNWFENCFSDNSLLKKGGILSEQEKNDFIYFDGNVQNLRIVTKLQTLNDPFGANFTYATLATIIKYPWKSNGKEVKNGKEKFGYFRSEGPLVRKIQKATGLKDGCRHPATYLLEAADDMIYVCDDIEDDVKKGYIQWEKEYEKIKKEFKRDDYLNLFNILDDKKTDSSMSEADIRLAKVRNFRNLVQGYLFRCAVNEFMGHYEEIMSGSYEKSELLACEDDFITYLKKEVTGKNCFGCHEVLSLELVGDRVVNKLLDVFVRTLIESGGKDLEDVRIYPGKIFSLISSNFKYVAMYDYNNEKHKESLSELSLYDKLHLAVDFISGMTDSYAVNLYQDLNGIRLPQ